MSLLVSDCPRCGAKSISFELVNQVYVGESSRRQILEVFCVCRHCGQPSIFLVKECYDVKGSHREAIRKGLNNYPLTVNGIVDVQRHIGLKDYCTIVPPKHLPDELENVFKEGAACMSINCYNAAATMFRLCLDMASQPYLPEKAEGLSDYIRRSLGKRLRWLFENNHLPKELKDLSICIREDGNDGAHAGTLNKEDAEDILDFTVLLLERLYTEPKRLKLAEERRIQRRQDVSENTSVE